MDLIKDSSYNLELALIDSKGDFVTGATITYEVYNSSTNILVTSGTMSEVGSSGIYQTSTLTFSTIGQYRIEYTTPKHYENIMETLLVTDPTTGGSGISSDKIDRILGLCQENYRIFDTQYDNANNLISATIKIYPSATDCENDTNATAEYQITASFNKKNRMTSYKVKKV